MGGWRGSPLCAPQPPRPRRPAAQVPDEKAALSPGFEPPRGRRCRSPASWDTAQTCLPEKQGKAEGSMLHPSPLTPLKAAGATLPQPALHSHILASLARVGRQDDPAQAQGTARPPAQLLHFRAFYGHRLRQSGSQSGFPACRVPARQGEGTLVGSPGDGLKAPHPPQSQTSGSAMEQQHFGGHHVQYTAKFTLCLLPCTEIDGSRDTPQYSARVL